MKNILVILLISFLLEGLAFAQSQKIIVKFKTGTSKEILDNFKFNSAKNGNTSIANLSSKYDIKNSKQLFSKLLPKIKKEDIETFGFDKIFIADISTSNIDLALSDFSKDKNTEYIHTNNKLVLNSILNNNTVPNDPYYSEQYYLQKILSEPMWDISTGDSTVVIGIIDTGLDFAHPDLQNSFYINHKEIPNNGIDDDGNGFVDDCRGWNFISNNNDPTDDNNFSHGTAVAGIISAGFNNGIGIASIAPSCKVLVLKAFDYSGNGYEDVVSSAILYGVLMNIKVFNLSFGDYIYSGLIRDVIRYAYSKNITIVCSAGNDATDLLHYPSAFDEVISVGASDELDRKASFSSFGETVDLYAPGSNILTTSRTGFGESQYGNNYAHINGTSFSAPIISAISALLISKNKNLTNEEIRGILVSSTDLFSGQSGWDHTYSSGKVNAFSSLNNVNNPSIARIYYPFQDFSTKLNIVPVYISAASLLFQSYSVFYGIGENPQSFIPIVSNISSQVIKDTVCHLDLTNLPDTSFTLRLAMNTINGKTIEHRLIMYKDKTYPSIIDYSSGDIIDKDNYSRLILFSTDKKTKAKIFYKRKNVTESFNFIYADAQTHNIGFVSLDHFAFLKSSDLIPQTDYEYYIEVQSLNGITSVLSDTSFHFVTHGQFNLYGYNEKPYKLNSNQICNTVVDIHNNGKKDLFLNDIKNNLKLNVFEFSGGAFTKISNDNWSDFVIARDLIDLNGNGKLDLLTSTGRNGAVYEASATRQLPTNKIWSDEGNDNFWSSRFADVKGNGGKDILGFGKAGLRILEYSGNIFTEIANLNFSNQYSTANSQNVLVEDFDGDGKNEIFFIDTYFPIQSSIFQKLGLNIYKYSSNNFIRIFTDSIDRALKGDNIVSGDFDGDGRKEFAIGTISNPSDLVQYYSLYVYKANGNQYNLLDRIDIYNYNTSSEISTKAGNIDNDNRDEVLINAGLNFYIFKFSNSSRKFEPLLYKNNVNSTNQIIFDFDNNGINEFGINTTQDSLVFYEKDIPFTGPATPLNFTAFGIDSNRVQLGFGIVANAEYYKIYRSENDSLQNYIYYDSTFSGLYFDNNVQNKKNYYYKITSVDTNNIIRESIRTNAVNVYVHNKSKLISITPVNGFINSAFSQKVSIVIPSMKSIILNDSIYPTNIGIKSPFEYFISFGNYLPNGNYTMKSKGLNDFYGSPVDTNSISFYVNQIDSLTFYIKNVTLADRYKLRVEFNMNVDSTSARINNNYTFEPFGFTVLSVSIDNINKNIVYLNLSNNAMIGASGKNYFLRVYNVFSFNGIKLVDGAGSSFGLSFVKENLDDVAVYPNPYSKKSNQNFITFANLTKIAKVYVYDLTGVYVASVETNSANGGVQWNLKTNSGKEIPTGIYLFRVEGKDSNGKDVPEKVGKFLIVK
jgi:subtilisin family serine protease